MQMNAMNQFGNRGFGGPPQPQRQGGRRGMNRGGGGFRNSRFDHNNQNQMNQNNQPPRNQNQGQGGQRPNEVKPTPTPEKPVQQPAQPVQPAQQHNVTQNKPQQQQTPKPQQQQQQQQTPKPVQQQKPDVPVVSRADNVFPNSWIGRGGPIEWPARSPDLTPLDFYVWGRAKELVYEVEINTKEELVTRIGDAFSKMKEEMTLNTTTKEIRRRCRACIHNRGAVFEQNLN